MNKFINYKKLQTKIKNVDIEKRSNKIITLSNNLLHYGMSVDSAKLILNLECERSYSESYYQFEGWTCKLECDSVVIIYRKCRFNHVVVDMYLKDLKKK